MENCAQRLELAPLALCLAAACSSHGGSDGSALEADVQPPNHGDLNVSVDGTASAVVTWTTDEPAKTRVDFGKTESYDRVAVDDTLATEHSITLGALDPDSVYHFRIASTDSSGNENLGVDGTFYSGPPPSGGVVVAGFARKWLPFTLSFRGPFATELDTSPNPFLDYRLVVNLSGPSGQRYLVPGFFDGDGVGGGAGTTWRVRFTPDEAGVWEWEARFVQGPGVAISLDPNAGTPLDPDGRTGRFTIEPPSLEASGFYGWGMLEYVGEHYLKFRDGPYFIKGGTDSPENLLAYLGFDNTFDQGGVPTTGLVNGLHAYDPHVADWGEAGLGTAQDPLFQSQDTGYDSRGIIGALNYLASKHVNSIYFLPMNLGGDGHDTCPFVGYANTHFDKTHYDVSKLRQWNMVFEHAQRCGILLHFVLGETETANENWLDNGYLGVERKLYYRELVARFGHHLALKWNLSEETSFSTQLVREFAQYIQSLDPYDHPIAFHTYGLPPSGDNPQWTAVLGDPLFSMSSIQGDPDFAGANVEHWRTATANAGRKWVIDYDESETALTDMNAELLRKKVLYDVLFSGGTIEWFAGYHALPLGGDLRMEDFGQREEMWQYTWIARSFVEANLPFWEMSPADGLVRGESPTEGGAEVFRKHDDTYAIYFPDVESTGTIDLSGTTGTFRQRWFDPVTGTFSGPIRTVPGGGIVPIGQPGTGGPHDDWVVLLQR